MPMIAERIWATRRIPKPARKEGSSSEGPEVDLPFRGVSITCGVHSRQKPSTDLGFRICHRCNDDPNRKHSDAEDLHRRIAFPPYEAYQHGTHAPSAAKDDVHRHGDMISKSIVIQRVHSEEEGYVGKPSDYWYCSRLEKERWMIGGKVLWPIEQRCYKELHEGDKDA